MIRILCLETTTTNCSVGISVDGNMVSLVEKAEKGYSHSENLHSFIEEAIRGAGIDINDLHAVAVSKGPGSYTGLRIGVSAAKGLCFSLDIPLISLPTLIVLAKQVSVKEGYIIPMLDARRMEVYSGVFNSEHQQVRDTKAELLSADSFRKYLEEAPVYFVGNSNEKCRSVIIHRHANFLSGTQLPSANEMGYLAFRKFEKNDFEDVAYFEPFYLKDFVATQPGKRK